MLCCNFCLYGEKIHALEKYVDMQFNRIVRWKAKIMRMLDVK